MTTKVEPAPGVLVVQAGQEYQPAPGVLVVQGDQKYQPAPGVLVVLGPAVQEQLRESLDPAMLPFVDLVTGQVDVAGALQAGVSQGVVGSVVGEDTVRQIVNPTSEEVNTMFKNAQADGRVPLDAALIGYDPQSFSIQFSQPQEQKEILPVGFIGSPAPNQVRAEDVWVELVKQDPELEGATLTGYNPETGEFAFQPPGAPSAGVTVEGEGYVAAGQPGTLVVQPTAPTALPLTGEVGATFADLSTLYEGVSWADPGKIVWELVTGLPQWLRAYFTTKHEPMGSQLHLLIPAIGDILQTSFTTKRPAIITPEMAVGLVEVIQTGFTTKRPALISPEMTNALLEILHTSITTPRPAIITPEMAGNLLEVVKTSLTTPRPAIITPEMASGLVEFMQTSLTTKRPAIISPAAVDSVLGALQKSITTRRPAILTPEMATNLAEFVWSDLTTKRTALLSPEVIDDLVEFVRKDITTERPDFLTTMPEADLVNLIRKQISTQYPSVASLVLSALGFETSKLPSGETRVSRPVSVGTERTLDKVAAYTQTFIGRWPADMSAEDRKRLIIQVAPLAALMAMGAIAPAAALAGPVVAKVALGAVNAAWTGYGVYAMQDTVRNILPNPEIPVWQKALSISFGTFCIVAGMVGVRGAVKGIKAAKAAKSLLTTSDELAKATARTAKVGGGLTAAQEAQTVDALKVIRKAIISMNKAELLRGAKLLEKAQGGKILFGDVARIRANPEAFMRATYQAARALKPSDLTANFHFARGVASGSLTQVSGKISVASQELSAALKTSRAVRAQARVVKALRSFADAVTKEYRALQKHNKLPKYTYTTAEKIKIPKTGPGSLTHEAYYAGLKSGKIKPGRYYDPAGKIITPEGRFTERLPTYYEWSGYWRGQIPKKVVTVSRPLTPLEYRIYKAITKVPDIPGWSGLTRVDSAVILAREIPGYVKQWGLKAAVDLYGVKAVKTLYPGLSQSVLRSEQYLQNFVNKFYTNQRQIVYDAVRGHVFENVFKRVPPTGGAISTPPAIVREAPIWRGDALWKMPSDVVAEVAATHPIVQVAGGGGAFKFIPTVSTVSKLGLKYPLYLDDPLVVAGILQTLSGSFKVYGEGGLAELPRITDVATIEVAPRSIYGEEGAAISETGGALTVKLASYTVGISVPSVKNLQLTPTVEVPLIMSEFPDVEMASVLSAGKFTRDEFGPVYEAQIQTYEDELLHLQLPLSAEALEEQAVEVVNLISESVRREGVLETLNHYGKLLTMAVYPYAFEYAMAEEENKPFGLLFRGPQEPVAPLPVKEADYSPTRGVYQETAVRTPEMTALRQLVQAPTEMPIRADVRTPIRTPVKVSVTAPTSVPVGVTIPVPSPVPVPDPTPDPVPVPDPTPDPVPVPDPIPIPVPVPSPITEPIPPTVADPIIRRMAHVGPPLGGDGDGRSEEPPTVPPGTYTWLQGIGWRSLIPPYTAKKPLWSKLPPKGAKTGGRTPAETIQIINPTGREPKSLSVDLGVSDIFIKGGGKGVRPTIEFKGHGMKTDVGKRIPGPAKGLSLGNEAAGVLLGDEPMEISEMTLKAVPKRSQVARKRKKKMNWLDEVATLKGFKF